MSGEILQTLDRVGTAGLGFVVLCLMRGWLRTQREIVQQRADFDRRIADYDIRIGELVALYRERLDISNTAAAEWRGMAYKAMGVVETKQLPPTTEG